MNYKSYVKMLRRSIERVNINFKNINDKMALFNTGVEVKHMEAIIDEAYDMDYITYNSYRLLRQWYVRYYSGIVRKIIWL